MLMLAGCSSLARFGALESKSDIPAASPPVAEAAAQSAAGDREHERILATYGDAYRNPKIDAAIAATVQRLVASSERPDLTYQVTVLNSPSINAFALPSGQLYLTRGLLALANDEAELSSVLSHEMAHVIARHASIRENQARQAAVVTRVVNEMGADAETSALALAKTKITLANFSRAQEYEADGIGVGISARAGYDPYGAVRFLTAMERNTRIKLRAGADNRSFEFLSSHPATPERIANARANARQFTAPGAGRRERGDYLAAIDGMTYGEDPQDGFVRGRKFLHPKLGLTFSAPEGFTLDNTAQAVIGISDDNRQAMRFDVVRVPAQQSLSDYLNSGWLENVDRSSTADMMINGFPAATASARGENWAFRIYALRFGSDVYRFIFATKQRSEETERASRESVGTFRRLSLAESQAIKPLRIKIVTVRPGDTAEALSRRMAAVDNKVELFRTLNGLDGSENPKPGDRVKLIIE